MIRSKAEAVALVRRKSVGVAAQEVERQLRFACRSRDHLAVAGAQQVAGVLNHTLDGRGAVVVLSVEAEERAVALEQRLARAYLALRQIENCAHSGL